MPVPFKTRSGLVALRPAGSARPSSAAALAAPTLTGLILVPAVAARVDRMEWVPQAAAPVTLMEVQVVVRAAGVLLGRTSSLAMTARRVAQHLMRQQAERAARPAIQLPLAALAPMVQAVAVAVVLLVPVSMPLAALAALVLSGTQPTVPVVVVVVLAVMTLAATKHILAAQAVSTVVAAAAMPMSP